MYIPRRLRSMGLFASGFGAVALGILLPDLIEKIRTGSMSVVGGVLAFALWGGCVALFLKLAFSKRQAPGTEVQLRAKLATVAVKPMFIPSEEGNLLSELQTLSGHKPITCTYLGGSGLQINANTEVLLTRLSDSIVFTVSGSAEKHVIPYNRLSALEISGPGTETTDAGISGGGFGIEGFLKGVVVAATINAITKKSTTNTFLRILGMDAEAYFHTANIEPSDLRILLSAAVVAIEAHKKHALQNGGTTQSIADEISKLNQMLRDGVIDAEEFSVAKKQLLRM